jgi:hypothetical protein
LTGENEAGEPEIVGAEQIGQLDARLGGDTDQGVTVDHDVGLGGLGVGGGGKGERTDPQPDGNHDGKTMKYGHGSSSSILSRT